MERVILLYKKIIIVSIMLFVPVLILLAVAALRDWDFLNIIVTIMLGFIVEGGILGLIAKKTI